MPLAGVFIAYSAIINIANKFLQTLQLRCMVRQMIRHEAGDEVITMVVTRMAAQGEWLADRLARRFKQLRMQLLG